MEVRVVIKLGRKYSTEEILKAFSKWGRKSYHSTTDAAGDVLGWYYQPVSGTICLGNKGSRHGSIEASLHLGRRFSNITLTVPIDDMANPGISLLTQYPLLLKKIENARKKLGVIGLFIKTKLEEDEPAPT